MSRRLNHSRYIDLYAKDIGDNAYRQAKETPTVKQVKFYNRLYAMCKEHGLETKTGSYAMTRAQYGMAIDTLLKRLQEAGVDVKGNGKQGIYKLTIGEDHRRRLVIVENILVEDKEVEDE